MADGTLRPSLTCHICLETFRTAKHLKRHAPTHDDAKPHVCHFCGAQYERSEARRRRWNAGTEIPKRSLSGKRKQACDLCTERKRACSTGSPCSECEMRKAECTYHRLRPSARLRESLDSAEQTPPESTAAGTAAQGIMGRIQAQADCVGCERSVYVYPWSSLQVQSTTVNPSSSQLKEDGGADWDGLLGTTVSNPFDCYLDEFESCLWSYTDTARGHIGEALLAKKACQSWDSLQCILDGLTEQPPRTFPSSEWFAFFSPANATRYLHLFWTRWYHHCPIVHKATFGLNTCSHLLLITMCLIGACMSARETDHQSANRFLDVIEIIFSNPLFLESPRKAPTNDTLLETQENIQILQATCFMCLLQKWEGSVQGFTAFVATTGAMGLS